MEFSLLGAAALGVGGLYAVLWFEAGRTNAADCTRDLWDMALGGAIVGLAAGRLWAMVAAGTNPITHPADILIVRGGVDTGAASVAAVATVAWLARKDLWRNLDALAPAAVGALALWHGGCLVRDACLGSVSSLPWAVAQDGSAVTRHPVEIYAALILLVATITLYLLKKRWPGPGVVAGTAVALVAAARLGTEPMRLAIGSTPAPIYAAGVAVGVGLVLWRRTVAGRRTAAGAS